MESFNKTLETLRNKRTEASPDTDSDTGSYGNLDAESETTSSEGEKLVISLEGGVELHIPTGVFKLMTAAMGDVDSIEPVEPIESPCMGGGPLMNDDESSEESSEESEKKECPFEKKEDSDETDEDSKKKDNDKKEED